MHPALPVNRPEGYFSAANILMGAKIPIFTNNSLLKTMENWQTREWGIVIPIKFAKERISHF